MKIPLVRAKLKFIKSNAGRKTGIMHQKKWIINNSWLKLFSGSFKMKKIFIFGVVIIFGGLIAWSLQGKKTIVQESQAQTNQVVKTIETNKKVPVLVELFTSEGCSSCPPADRVLAQLEKDQSNADAEIITLALHVDYWNYLGWRDEFSSAAYSQRQNGYADKFKLESIYTPQMVVDGQTQFVGSNLGTARKAIGEAAKTGKAIVELVETNGRLNIKIADLPAHDDSYVWLAIAEDNLKISVKRGENGGRTLDHTSVVRDLKLVGSVNSTDKNFQTETAFQTQSNWKKDDLKIVVFVQGKDSKKIFGVNRQKLNN